MQFCGPHRRVGEPWVVDQLGMAELGDQVGPEPVRLQHDEGEEPVVLGLVVVDQRVGHVGPVPPGHAAEPEQVGGQHRGADRPDAVGQQRVVDDDRLTGALPVEQGGGDPAGDDLPADDVTEAGTGLAPRVLARGGDDVGTAAPAPERRVVVAGPLGLRSALAEGGAPHVDDVRIDGPDVVHVDLELGPGLGTEVGQEDVGFGGQLQQQVVALLGLEVEGHAALAPVGQLDHVVDPTRAGRDQTGVDQSPLGIADLGVLDLQDVGPPLGQHGPGDGDVGPGRHLDDLDALHDAFHGALLWVTDPSSNGLAGEIICAQLVIGAARGRARRRCSG